MQIVEAAERLMNTRGANLRVEDVMAEAGASKAVFFHYFPTWDDLLDALRNRLVDEFDANHPLPIEADGPIDWPAVIETQAVGFIDHTLAHPGVRDAVFHSDFAKRRPRIDHAVARIAAMIRAGQEAEAFGPVDPDPTARLLFAVVHEAADAVAAGQDRAAILAALSALLRRTLAP